MIGIYKARLDNPKAIKRIEAVKKLLKTTAWTSRKLWKRQKSRFQSTRNLARTNAKIRLMSAECWKGLSVVFKAGLRAVVVGGRKNDQQSLRAKEVGYGR